MTQVTSRRVGVILLVVAGTILALVAILSLSRYAPPDVALAALAVVLVCLVVAIAGLWIRRTESVLTIILLLLFLVPENYVLVGPLRSVGNPAVLGGLFALVLWVSGRFLGKITPRPMHPARWTVLLFLVAAVTAFAAGMMRPLTQIESSGANRVLFPIAAMIGVALLACDTLVGRHQVETVLQRLVYIVGVAGVIGAIEFFFATFSYRTLMRLPGLTTNTELIDDTRSGFQRVLASAAHPIEYSVALAATAPLALHFALNARSVAARRASWVALIAICATMPMTVSRSGVVGIAVGLGWYALHLNNRARLNFAVLALIGLALMRAAIPGLLGTLRSLLFVGQQDPSIVGRTIDYAKIPGLMEGHLLVGRGLGTFQPAQYFFLDNAYLGALLEGGLLGLAALITLFVVTMGLARGARRVSTEPAVRSLGQAISAAAATLAVTALFFDEMAFKQTGFLAFLLLGLAGALWTREREQAEVEGRTVRRQWTAAAAEAAAEAEAAAAAVDRIPQSAAG